MISVSELNLSIIKKYEGFSATAYICPAGYKTIGYGHVIKESEAILAQTALTEDQALLLLRKDVAIAFNAVNRLVKIVLNVNQLSALVSLVFNIGAGNFQRSTLRMKLNRGDIEGAADEFIRWSKVRGKTLRGLLNRRIEEQALFLKPI